VKELLPMFRPQQDSNHERESNKIDINKTCECKRIDVQLHFLICDPTIAKDAKRTPATVSLFDLQGLQKKFISNHIV
jgi:hypothetical protein